MRPLVDKLVEHGIVEASKPLLQGETLMDLQQTIDELEKQSSQYAEAAQKLRELLPSSEQGAATPQNGAARRGRPRQTPVAAQSSESEGESGAKSSGRKMKKKRTMSPETRAKLSAAATARHAQRKAEAAS